MGARLTPARGNRRHSKRQKFMSSTDSHDQCWLARVAPSDWPTPTPKPWYHLVVLGGGPAGLVCAAAAAGLGARVALIERQLLGGDCLNVGCVPSKALLRSARAIAEVRRAGEWGIVVPPGVRADFAQMMQRLRRLRAELAMHDSAERFRSLGVDVFFGQAQLASPTTVRVGEQVLTFRRAAITTGSRPVIPSIPGLTEVGFRTNESIFDLDTLPQRLLILGGGPIGCELAQAFARLGARVTLVQSAQRLLPRDDSDASAVVVQALQADGVEVRLATEVRQFIVEPSGKYAVLSRPEGERIGFDELLLAVGRVPNVDGLNLAAAQVAFDRETGVQVDDRLRTTNRRIYAAGDVASRFRFTHAADAMARLLIGNALFPRRGRMSAWTIPWATYTDPELAQVGLTEAEAAQCGRAYRVIRLPWTAVDRAQLDGETVGFVKVIAEAKRDRILGVTAVGTHAGEWIGAAALAMRAKIGLAGLSAMVFPYPTRTEMLRKLGDAFNRDRLTPRVRWLLRQWLAWRF